MRDSDIAQMQHDATIPDDRDLDAWPDPDSPRRGGHCEDAPCCGCCDPYGTRSAGEPRIVGIVWTTL